MVRSACASSKKSCAVIFVFSFFVKIELTDDSVWLEAVLGPETTAETFFSEWERDVRSCVAQVQLTGIGHNDCKVDSLSNLGIHLYNLKLKLLGFDAQP